MTCDKKAFLILAVFLGDRELEPGELRMLGVEEAVRREMHDAVLPQITAERRGAAGFQIESLLPVGRRDKREDRSCFAAGEGKAARRAHFYSVSFAIGEGAVCRCL